MRWKRAARPLVAVAAGGTLLVWGAGVAMAGPGAPTGVTVTRNADDPSKVTVSWAPVEGATNYHVSVSDGGHEKVSVVPGSATSFAFDDAGLCGRWRFKVSSRDASGKGTASKSTWLDTAGPGEASNVKVTRSADATAVTVTWQPPAHAGDAPVSHYDVALSVNAETVRRTVTGLSTTFTDVSPTMDALAMVSPYNSIAGCTSTHVMSKVTKDPDSDAPAQFKVNRDPADPRHLTVTWQAPKNTSHGAVDHYTFIYLYGSTTWKSVDLKGTSTTVDLPETWNDPDGAQFGVQAWFADGQFGGHAWASLGGKPYVPSQKVTVSHTFGRVFARLDLASGQYAAYPNAVLRISRADGYSSEEWLEPGTRSIAMYDVPKGVYTVTVSGANEFGEEEWSRQTVQIGGDTLATDADFDDLYTTWKGASGNSVMAVNKPLGSQDQSLAYTIDTAGDESYAALVRMVADAYSSKQSGLVFRYEPKHTETVDGKALTGPGFSLVKLTDNTECGKQLAGAFAPPATFGAGRHRVVVRAIGNTFTATVDGKTVLQVSDLKAVNAANCGGDVPRGEKVGVHVWHDSYLKPFSNIAVGTGA
jgi:hypothetical protein